MNLVGRYAEQSSKTSLRHRQTLARRIDRERVPVPCRDNRVRLHRIVILRRGLVGLRERLFCRGKPGLNIAAMRFRRKAWPDSLQSEGFAGIEADACRFDLVTGREQVCAFR